MKPTEAQIEFYEKNGYLVIENVVSAGMLKRIRTAIMEFRETAGQIKSSNAKFDLAPSHGADNPMLRRVKHPVEQHPVFDELMRSDDLLDIVSPLLGGTVRFDHSKLNFKPAGGQAKIEWHQDWAFYPHTNDDLLAVGVMIEDCNEENGPLKVIPGSHKGPVYNHHNGSVFAGGVPEDELADQARKAVSLTARAGSISIHHVRTLHASSNNFTDRDRPLLLYSYSAVDAFPVMKENEFEEYNNRILRGEATLAPRSEAVPMRLPLPRDKHADSIYDNQTRMMP
ncbi:MAG: phytanoyl-CoA dioxygenase family protein [Roseovarius sp.]|nr:phytanoyl-CoA dioxygenase family protein [Roseovarius sp.]MCY4291099.1 phytanoyl-CoA dioxygenase family protein [Roseovarius sp.]MCY4316597.1 phytanoyl-CoA dioxygenase family protein [Roseovarius sp.]